MQDQEALERYFAWDPREDEDFRPMIVGEGSIGGKGRSLLYAARRLWSSGNDLLTSVRIPPSLFIGTGVFQEVVDQLGGQDRIKELVGDDGTRVEQAFLSAKLPPTITSAIGSFLATVEDPVVVRSSSVLEDSIKHSFAGKYRSTFLMNRGSMEERIRAVEEEMLRIYARTFFPTAIGYRKKHKLGDDMMGIIVMRMSGRWRGRYYYPTTGGVGYSRNVRRWTTRVRMEDGILRFVFGLGTMSTKRGYARTFSLTNPALRPEGSNPYKIMKHAQERFQAIDGNTGELVTLDVKEMWRELLRWHPNLGIFAQLYTVDGDTGYFSSVDYSTEIPNAYSKVCFTFEDFPKKCRVFFDRMRVMLPMLEQSMGVPADIEYAYEPGEDQLELLQSRPLWIGGSAVGSAKIPDLTGRKVILMADRMVTDGVLEDVKYLVYVDYRIYGSGPDFHSVARGIGYVNQSMGENRYILVAPGRVGSSNPELGVPVQYNELTQCACIVELGIPRSGHMPELSYGTHFFSDLETDNVMYMPVYDGEKGNLFDQDWFDKAAYAEGPHMAIRIYRGSFSVYSDGTENRGVVVVNRVDPPCDC